MDIGYLNELVSPVALGIALCVGFLLKYCISSEKINRFIPVFSAVIGLVCVSIVDLAAGEFSMTSILSGLISGLAATGLYEAFKNLFNIPTTEGNVTVVSNMLDSHPTALSAKQPGTLAGPSGVYFDPPTVVSQLSLDDGGE